MTANAEELHLLLVQAPGHVGTASQHVAMECSSGKQLLLAKQPLCHIAVAYLHMYTWLLTGHAYIRQHNMTSSSAPVMCN
jgi:hypothetical protein